MNPYLVRGATILGAFGLSKIINEQLKFQYNFFLTKFDLVSTIIDFSIFAMSYFVIHSFFNLVQKRAQS